MKHLREASITLVVAILAVIATANITAYFVTGNPANIGGAVLAIVVMALSVLSEYLWERRNK